MTSHWAQGYSREELERAQETFGLVFPPDLVDLFLDRRPVQGYDWRTDHSQIRAMLTWPLEGLLFDVENNEFWLDEWEGRPRKKAARAEIVAAAVSRAPTLIPLVGHRFLPAEPNETGNPVFSIYQTDIIYYGANLEHYFDNEFRGWSAAEDGAYRHIRFWSDLAG